MAVANEPSELPDTWVEAANAAEFKFYELTDPTPDYRWAGGYGWGDGPMELEILHRVDGVEVSVVTNVASERPPGDWDTRQLLWDLVVHALAEGNDPVVLPMTLTISAGTRTIDVDGVATVFEGAELDAGGWAGSATLEDGKTVSVRVRGGSVVPLAISVCSNWAMPDRPPIER